MRALLIVVAASVFFGVVPVAQAGTASMERVRIVDEFGDVHYVRTVTFTGAPNESSDLGVSIDVLQQGGLTRSVVFADAGGITAAGLCEQEASTRVACDWEPTESITSLTLELRDGADSVTVESNDRSGPLTSIDLGDGDDSATGSQITETIHGGAGADLIDGLAGTFDADSLNGGPGPDEVRGSGTDSLQDGDSDEAPADDVFVAGDGSPVLTYRSRSTPITVDLRAGTAGTEGEEDRLTGITAVIGGSGDDTMTGTDGDDFLSGGDGGNDRLSGLGGDDILDGFSGLDRVHGGDGADRFTGFSDNALDRLACGPGPDLVEGQDARDVLRRNCDRAGWSTDAGDSGFPGGNTIAVRPRVGSRRVSFRATCGLSPCRGRLELRTRGDRRLLAEGRFRLKAKRSGRLRARLTDLGRRRLAEGDGRYVRIVIRTRHQCADCHPKPPVVNNGFTTFVGGS